MQFRPSRSPQPPPRLPAVAAIPEGDAPDIFPKPNWTATGAAIFGIALTALLATGLVPSHVARQAAYGILISLAISIGIEARAGVRNLIRADLLAIVALFYLTLYEFLFPQPFFDTMTSMEATNSGLLAVYLAFGSLLLGRHVPVPKKAPFARLLQGEVPIGKLLGLFWLAAGLGYFWMLACSEWNPVNVFQEMLGARFSQPWSRGQLGDWRAIFSELTLMLYLLPALAGVMLARAERYRWYHLGPVLVVLLFTFFQGFATGTRNVFGAYLVNFLAAFAFASPAKKQTRVLAVAGVAAVAMAAATFVMLQFREHGIRDWMHGTYRERGELQSKHVFVDYNLQTIATLTSMFPRAHPFLGMEIPYLALIRPIPRAIWPDKPKGLSTTIEQAMGYEGVTISATFAGESYISGGFLAIVVVGLGLGAVMGFWNTTASPRNSEIGILVYASGFFAAVITMRSLFAFTTAVLPTIASLCVAAVIVNTAQAGVVRMAKVFQRRAPKPLQARPRTAGRQVLVRRFGGTPPEVLPKPGGD